MSTLVKPKRSIDGSLGAELLSVGGHKAWGRSSQSLGNLCDFSGKNSHFNSIWITFREFLEPFERTKFLKFGNHHV